MKLTYLITAFLLFTAIGGYAQQKRDTIHYQSNTQKKVKLTN